MTDTTNIALKKYGATDPANLLTGYNASMDTLDTVIKQAQDDIVTLQNSVARKASLGVSATSGSLNANVGAQQYIQIAVESSLGKYLVYFTDTGITLYNSTTGQVMHHIPWQS